MLLKQINNRKLELQNAWQQFEHTRVGPLYKQLEDINGIINTYKNRE